MKTIKLTEKYNCDHLLGKFLEHDSYDTLVNEDVDVYKPITPADDGYNERNILLKFRKGVFNKNDCETTYKGLLTGATSTDNRGLAAGSERTSAYQTLPGTAGLGKRRWVTKREKTILSYFASGSPNSLFGDRADELYNTTPDTPLEGRGTGGTDFHSAGEQSIIIKGGSIWIVKHAKDINFDVWFQETKLKSSDDRKKAAIELCNKHISQTSYGEAVNSGVAGYMDRYPRIPFCRETGWSAGNRDKFESAFPLITKANQIFKNNFPVRWSGQNAEAQKLDKAFRIADTVYTTVTINKHFRTACHRDAGDLCEDGSQQMPRGFSNLTVVSNGKTFDGFYLCMPEYRVAVNIQAGDLLMMDAHQIHGNVPMISCEEGFERLSLVFYFRDAMLECGSIGYEETRRKFVNERRFSKENPNWAPGWNGVSPGMWDTIEWRDYLYSNGLDEEADKLIKVAI